MTRTSATVLLAALLVVNSCGDEPPKPTTLKLDAGDGQTATVGTAVATNPRVKVTDDKGNGMAGVPVTFALTSGGGTVVGVSQTTDLSGNASVGSWTLGTTAGTNTLQAIATGLTGSPVTFTATATAGTATNLTAIAGASQSTIIGTEVSAKPSVKVTDGYGNVISGLAVTFAVASGAGSITGATQLTTSTGLATVGSWKLGCGLGAQTLTATAAALAPVTFIAQGVDPPAVTAVSATTSFGILVGDTVTLAVKATAADESTVPCRTPSFGTPSTGAVSVNSSGLVTGVARGFASIPVSVDGVNTASTLSVYTSATLDSVRFTSTNSGSTVGWTATTLAVGSSFCASLHTFDPNNRTVALRWTPSVSDSAVVSITRDPEILQSHCFRAVKAGTVTVFGTFGGKTGQKVLTIP